MEQSESDRDISTVGVLVYELRKVRDTLRWLLAVTVAVAARVGIEFGPL